MYSQHNEDEFLLKFIKNNRLRPPKTVVEIGAWDAVERSNSRMFILRGWKAILVEPIIEQYYKIVNFYEGNKNIIVLNCAIGPQTGKGKFVTHPELPDHAHLSDPRNENYNEREEKQHKPVHVYTLEDLLRIASIKDIGILSIDTEGMDSVIAKQLIDSKCRPWFIIIEGNNAESTRRQRKILSKDYTMIKIKNVNTIWIHNGI